MSEGNNKKKQQRRPGLILCFLKMAMMIRTVPNE